MVEASLASIAPLGRRACALLAESWRYFVVSLAALALDYGLLVALTEFGRVHYLVSAAVGFTAGLGLSYVLSIAFVFRERRLTSRWLELGGFVAVGLAGLVLNEALMKLFVETAGLGYALAKVPAAGVSFVFNYAARRVLLFTKSAGGVSAD